MADIGLPTVLTPDAGAFTILSPASGAETKDAIFLNRIDASKTPQILDQNNKIRSTLQNELNKIALDQIALNDLQDEADNALKIINDAINRTNQIRDYLDNAIKIALQADDGNADNFPALASSFDTFINSIINTANTGPTPNLIGDQPQSSLTFRTGTNGVTFTVDRVFLGTDYTITEDVSGDVFVRVDDTKTLHETSAADGTFTGTFASLFTGIRLDSFNSSTNAIGFSFAPDTAGETSFTGTLSTSGLGIGNAFIYDNLESQAGRDRAVSDLEAAKIAIDQQLVKFNAAQAHAQLVLNNSSRQLDDLQNESDNLTINASFEIQGLAAKAQGLNQLNQNFLESQKTFREELLKLIPVKGVFGKITGSLLDIAI